MAQENHEIVPYNPANFPIRRKRGRPRKYDYPGYEPRRRAQTYYPRPNPSQPNANPSGQVVQPQPNPSPSSSQVPCGSAAHTAATPASTASHCHPRVPVGPTAANSCHGPDDLLGKTVSGVLDGIFDSGYLLTVRVGPTGPVLKGLVFDPRVSVPLSEDNDVAPLLPMTKRGEIPIPGQAPISIPVQSVPNRVTVAQPIQMREPGCELSPPLSRKRATKHDGKHVSPDMQFALKSELRAKILRALLNKAASDANAQSTSAAPSKSGKRFKQNRLPSGSSAGKIETSKDIADTSEGGRNINFVEGPRECEGSKQIKGPSGQMQQVATIFSVTDGSSGQMEQPNTQHLTLSKNKGLSGQIQQAGTPISGLNATDQPPDQTPQPHTEPSCSNEIKESSGKIQDPVTEASGLNGTEVLSGENNLPAAQSSEQLPPSEESKEEPGENEHLDPVAADKSDS
ncbi:uncharacterized protein LOC109724922 isoform X2 [Ananas comosus]|uniref:Uncharacterized protein LOC109724922 isoform X2 n=1 Tax=Ananas comosus TaxID=4615 RepID=A0A6P5GUE3_ANACO|nr:uncharacterized protein LOC109724922 isoform X2 [Ananas comosus]